MSRTPYIVCTSSGQKAPNAARKISLRSVVPSVRKRRGISAAEGIGRRNSIGTLKADAAKSLTPRPTRSEERRVGKECRSRWSPYH